VGKGDRRKRRRFIRDFWEMENFHFECEGKEWIKKYYFVCDFNGRWLKDLSFLCCIDVLLSVEGKIVLVIKV
jgi:hypothetical protein